MQSNIWHYDTYIITNSDLATTNFDLFVSAALWRISLYLDWYWSLLSRNNAMYNMAAVGTQHTY